MQVAAIKKVQTKREQEKIAIDEMIEAIDSPIKAKAAKAVTNEDDTTDTEKVTLDLQTIWPIAKSIFAFIRPMLFFSKKWRDILDRLIAGLDVLIPEKD